MTSKPPQYVLDCLKRAGERFYASLDALDWPDADRDAPAKEANIVFHIACELVQANLPFHVYLEAAVPTSGRIDLLAVNDEIAIALEAKCFGDIGKQAKKLSNDVIRLRKDYFPQYAKPESGVEAEDWWRKASVRWGFAVAASFRGDEVAEAWTHGDSTLLRDEKDRAGFDDLLGEIDNEYCDAFFINDGSRWKRCGRVYFLVAAFEIKS